MPINTAKVDLVIQYALLVAGQEDEYFEKQLGPIHLIKYVYLADLVFALRNDGETFTHANWQFYKFGPWTQEVNARIEPALTSIHADKKILESKYEERDDWTRWSLHDEYLLEEKEKELPATITMRLRHFIHTYKADTPSLLDYVYKTKPMLHAAPNEKLDFSFAVNELKSKPQNTQPPMLDSLSNKKKKKLNERMRQLRENSKTKSPREKKLIKVDCAPHFDEVYSMGLTWLDSLAGPDITTGKKIAEFSDDVWKSPTRQDEDVS